MKNIFHSQQNRTPAVGISIVVLVVLAFIGWQWFSSTTAARVQAETTQHLIGQWERIHDAGEGGILPVDDKLIASFRADGTYAEYHNGVLDTYGSPNKNATSSATWAVLDTTKHPSIPVPGGGSESIVGQTVVELDFPNEVDYLEVSFDPDNVLTLTSSVSGYANRYTKVEYKP